MEFYVSFVKFNLRPGLHSLKLTKINRLRRKKHGYDVVCFELVLWIFALNLLI